MAGIFAFALVTVFVAEVVVGAAGNERALVPFGALITRGWSSDDWWRVLTFSFLHLNWLHLALNVAALLWLGRMVERRLGALRLTAIVAASAVASGTAGMLLGRFLPTSGIAVGASGAICGLLAAAVMLAFRRDADRPLRLPLAMCFAALIATSLLPDVSLAGHLGGLLGGFLIATPMVSRSAIESREGAVRSVGRG
jgi:rhomboid protease GluP